MFVFAFGGAFGLVHGYNFDVETRLELGVESAFFGRLCVEVVGVALECAGLDAVVVKLGRRG